MTTTDDQLRRRIAKKCARNVDAHEALIRHVDAALATMNGAQHLLDAEIHHEGDHFDDGEVEFHDCSITFTPATEMLERIWSDIKDLPDKN
ncbi:MAG: hypothetical protein GYA24_05210 [Candidatus Lokiarchaeota archaeon]|nr:hypothetical protein [Candidatus Lokiarchaeota archaeon]